LGNVGKSLIVTYTVIICFILFVSANSAFAQDLSPMELPDRKIQKMDSSLATLYEIYQQGGNTSAYVASQGIFEQGNNVRVVIELSSKMSTLPQNLGINIETSYETSIQALVPISNLETVSSLDQVKFVRAPIVGVADQTILESETEDYLSLLAFLVIIPAAVIAIFYYKKRR